MYSTLKTSSKHSTLFQLHILGLRLRAAWARGDNEYQAAQTDIFVGKESISVFTRNLTFVCIAFQGEDV